MGSAVVPFPGGRIADGLELQRLVPSGRSIATGLVLLVVGLGVYLVARNTSAFAVREIAVEGPPAHVAKQVTTALRTTRGDSLLALDVAGLQARVESVPSVAAARFDRAFPNTLRVIVVPERPVAVLRQGGSSWLVAASGRVIKTIERRRRAGLPRIWLGRDVELRIGNTVAGDVRVAVRTVAPLVRSPLPARVASVRYRDAELTLVLRSGVEIRFGDSADRALKLELARRIIPRLTPDEVYLDVSVPARPVAGTSLKSQVEVESRSSTTP